MFIYTGGGGAEACLGEEIFQLNAQGFHKNT